MSYFFHGIQTIEKLQLLTMFMFTATHGSYFHGLFFTTQHSNADTSVVSPAFSSFPYIPQSRISNHVPKLQTTTTTTKTKFSITENSPVVAVEKSQALEDSPTASPEPIRLSRVSADWKQAKDFNEKGWIYKGRVEGFNAGGVLIRFRSVLGFLPYRELSPSHTCKESHKTGQDIGKRLLGATISTKVIEVHEEKRKLILSEKRAAWSLFSQQVHVGDIFEARVASVEDYGGFVHLRFPDGLYHITGVVHVSEVSWDFLNDARHVLVVGDDIRVKVIDIDRDKRRVSLSIKQLEEDPFHETLDKVMRQVSAVDTFSQNRETSIEPLPGLEAILAELEKEDGIEDAKIIRQGFERRVVSPDLQLWLSNAPPEDQVFSLLARAGRQVQEIHLTTSLDQEGIKRALQRVLERVP